jgi:Kef-type K+ transport system membrane component KefB
MTLLLLQMAVVLLTALGCGWVARRLGQAQVIGEIVGGILLGPSVFGRVAPHASAALFPQNSLASFEILSTVGLVLFMFLVGNELDYGHLREQKAATMLTSTLSILVPFAMAAGISPLVRSRFAPEGINGLPFLLFLGISMSITAVPVLARILQEREMQSTALGTLSLMCAAVNDVCAWLLLAVALTMIPYGSGAMPVSQRLLWLAGYLAVMLGGVRPVGMWLARRRADAGLSYEMLAIVVAIVFVSAAATEAIGVHPLFGAFLAGVCFPRVGRWQSAIHMRLDTIVSVLLLPLFFALTGMRTRLDLLNGAETWLWTTVLLTLAVAGKMVGAVIGARWTGLAWRNSWALGALLNTRGLVELIVLNIAYSAHVFSPALFTMLVIMALLTTMMTTPMLNLLGVGSQSIEHGNIRDAEIV